MSATSASAPAPWGQSARLPLLLGLFAALLPVAFHARFLSGDAVLYLADTAQLQLPRYLILSEALQQRGELPLWQDLLYGGAPFHASPENPTLYPPVVLLAALLPPLLTINLTILLHLALAGLGMHLLVVRLWRRIAAERGEAAQAAPGGPAIAAAGGVLAATVFALSHTTRVDHIHLVTYGAAHALLPWILLAVDSLLHGPRPARAAGLLALALSALVFTGGLFVIAYAVPLLGAWFLFLGLLGGREARRRTLLYGSAAACAAALIVMAKLVPYAEWVGTTNRHGKLPYDEAVAVTLGGHGDFDWSIAWEKVKRTTGRGWALLPALLALPLLRHGVVRVALGLGLVFFGVALGEPLHRLAYDWIPPLDQTRSAIRAWVVPNLMLPLLGGLGLCWLLARAPQARRHGLLAAAVGVVLALALAPGLDHSGRFEPYIENPESLREVRGRYVHWPEAARRAGSDWRAVYFDKAEPDGKNEQMISSLLGVETPAGYLGHVWPWRLERHLYGPAEARLAPWVRGRRLGVLSARYAITNDGNAPPPPERGEIVPAGVDGTRIVENPFARPRAFVPAAAIGLAGDAEDRALYALLDEKAFPLTEASIVVLDEGAPVRDEELEALDLLVLGAAAGDDLAQRARALELPVLRLGAPSDGAASREAVLAAAADLAARREPRPARFERLAPGRTRVEGGPAADPRWLVVSEPWALYPGWSVVAEATGAPLPVRRADGVVSAVLVQEAGAVLARYEPASVVRGLWLGIAGLLVALALLARA